MLTDSTAKRFIGREDVFADIFNQHVFGGEKRLSADSLKPFDNSAIMIYGKNSPLRDIQKQRDVFKCAVSMTDDQAVYLMLGIENQTAIHYAMPVKNLMYDAAEYQRQVEATGIKHRKEKSEGKDRGKVTPGEFLSGFRKEDKLVPVITLVVYFGDEPWDGPKSIHEMFGPTDPELLCFVPDYKINLVSFVEMSDEEIEQFSTVFQLVAGFAKRKRDKKLLRQYVSSHEKEFSHFDPDASHFLASLAELPIDKSASEGGVNVCKGIQGMIDDAVVDAVAKTKEEARQNEMKTLVETVKTLGHDFGTAIDLLVSQKGLSKEEAETAVRAIWG